MFITSTTVSSGSLTAPKGALPDHSPKGSVKVKPSIYWPDGETVVQCSCYVESEDSGVRSSSFIVLSASTVPADETHTEGGVIVSMDTLVRCAAQMAWDGHLASMSGMDSDHLYEGLVVSDALARNIADTPTETKYADAAEAAEHKYLTGRALRKMRKG